MTPKIRQAQSPFIRKLAQQKWLTLIGLPVLLIAMFNSIYSIWGALFIYWGITSITSRQAFLLEVIEQRDDPVLFWLIVGMWIGSGGLYILSDFFPAILL